MKKQFRYPLHQVLTRALVVCISLLALSMITQPTFAASDTWSAVSGTGNWNTAAAWVGGSNPGNGTTTGTNTDIGTFSGTSTFQTVNLATDRNMGGISFIGSGSYSITSTSSGAGRYFFTRGGTTEMTSGATASQSLSGAFVRLGAGISGSNNYTFLNNAASSANTFTLGAIRNSSGTSSTLIFGGINTGTNTVAGVIDETTPGTNALAVTKQDAGTWILDAANTYTAGTTLNAGILGLGSATALGSGTLTINGGAIASNVSARTVANTVSVGGNFALGGLGQSITLNGTMDLGGSVRTITLQNSASIGGVISNGGLSLSSSSATRSLTLTGSNTSAGATTVNSGMLLVNGSLAAGSAVAVNGGMLGGSGTISGVVTVNGGTLSPGSSSVNIPGILTVGSLVLSGSSSTIMEVNGTATRGTDYDGINITTGSGLTYGGNLLFTFGNITLANTTIDIFNFTGSPSPGFFANVTSTGGTGGIYAGTWTNNSGTWSLPSGGQTLSFVQATGDLSVVPEPAAWMLLTVGLTFVMIRRRRA